MRFERQYRSNQQSRKSQWSRRLSIGLGIIVVLLGLVALPAPGPGVLVIGLGAALLARESLWVAQRLDQAEVKLRRLLRRGGTNPR